MTRTPLAVLRPAVMQDLAMRRISRLERRTLVQDLLLLAIIAIQLAVLARQ
jgi:hypothetical protein